ncbi:MAG: hypothetical protein Q7K57_52420 [Burkholderiaceae bacterium]|nr:hypothetical protein [Burkholderiaceae bacterium]
MRNASATNGLDGGFLQEEQLVVELKLWSEGEGPTMMIINEM